MYSAKPKWTCAVFVLCDGKWYIRKKFESEQEATDAMHTWKADSRYSRYRYEVRPYISNSAGTTETEQKQNTERREKLSNDVINILSSYFKSQSL